MNWLVSDYIKYYEDVIPNDVCENIMDFDHNFQPSTYANSKGKIGNSDERVRMDECWIKDDSKLYGNIKASFEGACRRYSEEFSLFSVQRMTDFRINRYSEGGFMSSHIDNIHHSHGQKYGYPQVSVLLYLNDDYKGGEFFVAEHQYLPKKGSAIIFPSNFMFPHEATIVTKGIRWSIVAWLM